MLTDTQAICAVFAGLLKPVLTMVAVGLGWWLRGTLGRPHEVMRYRLNGNPLSQSKARAGVEAASVLLAIWVVLMPAYCAVVSAATPSRSRCGASSTIAHPEIVCFAARPSITSMTCQ